MSRQARIRIVPPEGFLHVISRGNNRRKLFLQQKDFRIFYRLLIKLKGDEKIKIYHYCLMSNHVHLLLGTDEGSNLSLFMKRLNLTYSNYYRKKHDYVGHLWQGRFKSKVIDNDEYFLQCGKYIELNPVRAKIVALPQDYYYSSYHYYACGAPDELLTSDPFYLGLGSTAAIRQEKYKNLIIKELNV